MYTEGVEPERRSSRFERYDCQAGCPVEAALEVIGGKWKGVALYHLAEDGTLRFNALKKRMGAVTQRMLTKQLRELEADGIIARKVYPVVPPKVEYSLTERGQSLIPLIGALYDWGREHALDIVDPTQEKRRDREIAPSSGSDDSP